MKMEILKDNQRRMNENESKQTGNLKRLIENQKKI